MNEKKKNRKAIESNCKKDRSVIKLNMQKNRPDIKSNGKKDRPDICPISKKCGGCAYQGMAYADQLKKKERQVRELLKPYCPVQPIIGMEDPWHYRNKVHAVLDRRRDGTIISGVYERGSHRVVPVESCMIEDETADCIIRDIRKLLGAFRMKIYDEDTGYGLFRHVLIRRGFASGEILVVLVLASPVFPSKVNFVRELLKLHPEITTIVHNVNDRKTSMVLGERNIVLYGKGYIEDTLCGQTFGISPGSFYQVNPVQTEKLYGKAIQLAGLTGRERVIDAYCGVGTIGLTASRAAGEVIGVELNPDAVRNAVSNAKRNGITNARFFQGDAGAFMRKMAQRGEKADVVFMDPPRAGSDEVFLSSVLRLAPKRLVYISCNPQTLARDLRCLTRHGYRAEEAWPVDMFPWTDSIETVCKLVLRNPATHVNIDVDKERAITDALKHFEMI